MCTFQNYIELLQIKFKIRCKIIIQYLVYFDRLNFCKILNDYFKLIVKYCMCNTVEYLGVFLS